MKNIGFRYIVLIGAVLTSASTIACEKPDYIIDDPFRTVNIKCSNIGFHEVNYDTGSKGYFNRKIYKWGVVDSKGKLIVPFKSKSTYISPAANEDGVYIIGKTLYGKLGNKIATTSYSEISEFGEGLARVKYKGKYGYIDTMGKEVVKPTYYKASKVFENGRAWVKESKNGLIGFINTQGQVVIPLQFNSVWNFSEGLARVKLKDSYMYIDSSGKKVLDLRGYSDARPFYHDLAAVKKGKVWGVINKSGVEVVPPQYKKIRDFTQVGNKVLAGVYTGDKYGYIDQTGKLVISPKYSSTKVMNNGYIQVEISGRDPDKTFQTYSDYWGITDALGKEILPAKFRKIEQIAGYDYLYLAYNNKYDVTIFDTRTGSYNQKDFDNIGAFSNNFVWVERDGKFGYVNSQNQLQIPIQFDKAEDFKSNGLAKIKKDGRYNFIDKQGNPISSINFNDTCSFFRNDGLCYAKVNDKYGYISNSGKLVIPAKYDSSGNFEQGKASVTIKGDGYYPSNFKIDKKGKALTKRKSVAKYQKSLQAGSNTAKGMVIEVKGGLVKVQDDSRQCSQRNYKNKCMNWINTPTEKWVKRSQIVPSSYYF